MDRGDKNFRLGVSHDGYATYTVKRNSFFFGKKVLGSK
jgi:hypothetical protein